MNKNHDCSSPAESDDDHDYMEIDELGTGSTYKQCADDDEGDDDDDDDYVNTKDLDNRPTSKQSADVDESDDDGDDYVNTEELYKRPETKQSSVEMRKCEKKDLRVHELLSENQNVYDHTMLKVIQRAPASSNGRLKILLMILVLLLGTLAALCALILYLSNVASFHTIMKVQKREAADLRSCLNQVQVSFENVSEQLNTSKGEIRKCEMNYQRVHKLSEKQAICEQGWRSLGLKSYFFSDDKLNWMESRDSCVKKGADLVIITSQKEQDFLSSLAKETSWIGLNDRETEGKWMWVNKQTLEETGVTLWYQRTEGKSEPDNWKMEDPMGENCVCLGHSVYDLDQWFDVSCLLKKKYICQK